MRIPSDSLFGELALVAGFGERLRTASRKQLLEVRDRSLQAFREHYRRSPIQQLLCLTDIGAALFRIVLRQSLVDDS